MNWYIKVIVQFFDFSSRARRREFWTFNLISLAISMTLRIMDVVFNTFYFSIFATIYGMLVFIPSLAVSLRRLHDVGKSAWYIFLVLIPLIGWIWLLILFSMDGEEKHNQWGKNPKGLGSDRFINQIGKE